MTIAHHQKKKVPANNRACHPLCRNCRPFWLFIFGYQLGRKVQSLACRGMEEAQRGSTEISAKTPTSADPVPQPPAPSPSVPQFQNVR